MNSSIPLRKLLGCAAIAVLFASTVPAQSSPHAGSIPLRPDPKCDRMLPLQQFETIRPNSVKLGDLDGDGDFDLVVRRPYFPPCPPPRVVFPCPWGTVPPSFSVLRNRGDGTFDPEVVYSVPGIRELAIGDVDGDRDLDLAVARDGVTLKLMINDGQGAFTQGSSLSVGTDANAVAIEDLNGDGAADIVACNQAPPSISVLLNSGDGAFAAQVPYRRFGAPTSIAIADLDADGDADIATANRSTDTVSVQLNAGNGSFSPEVSFGVGDSPNGIVIGFLDANPGRDLALRTGNPPAVSVLSNNGSGAFGPALQFPVSSGGSSLVIWDFDGDVDRDLLAPIGEGLTILRNAGNGDFSEQTTIPTTGDWVSAAVADFDGDGDRDVALADESSFGIGDLSIGNVTMLFNRGDGELALPKLHAPIADGFQDVVIADMNGDRARDLIAVAIVPGSPAGRLQVSLNSGNGSFASPMSYDIGFSSSLAVGDLDGDGDPDIAGNGCNASVFMNNGDGTLAPPTQTAGACAPAAMFGDVDGDGDGDLVYGGLSTISVLMNQGGGTFAPPASYAALPGSLDFAFEDLDGDGDRDVAAVAWSQASNSLAVHWNQGDGTFAPYVIYAIPGTSPWSVAVADLDADGDKEIAVAHSGGRVTVFRNEGNGVFPISVTVAVGNTLGELSVGDADDDGDPDIAAWNYDSSPGPTNPRVVVLLNSGAGDFSARKYYGIGSLVQSYIEDESAIAIGDLNGDGMNDLVVPCWPGLSVLLSECR